MTIRKGEVSFITGAASGIGKALAESLISEGGLVILVDFNGEAAQDYADELNKKVGSLVAIAAKADTTKFEDQVAAYELAKEKWDRIDYVFANAGIAERPWIPTPSSSPSDALSNSIVPPDLTTLNIDLIGQLNTAALALQIFDHQEKNALGLKGKLILTASVFGYYPSASMPMYASAKAGIVNFMRSAAEFYKERGVTVNCIAPNLIDTPIAPDVLFVPFRERNLLTPISLVIEQFHSLLGDSTATGQAISINATDVWIHPPEAFKFKENDPACKLIDLEIAKLFGYVKA